MIKLHPLTLSHNKKHKLCFVWSGFNYHKLQHSPSYWKSRSCRWGAELETAKHFWGLQIHHDFSFILTLPIIFWNHNTPKLQQSILFQVAAITLSLSFTLSRLNQEWISDIRILLNSIPSEYICRKRKNIHTVLCTEPLREVAVAHFCCRM